MTLPAAAARSQRGRPHPLWKNGTFRTQLQKPSARRVAALAALPVVAALALTGCSTDDTANGSSDSAASSSNGSSTTGATGGEAAPGTAVQAKIGCMEQSLPFSGLPLPVG